MNRLAPVVLVLLFVALAALNSAGWIPALAGMTSFGELAALGWRPIVLLAAETVFLALLVVGGLHFL